MTSTFVYDGDCSFCTTCAHFIERRIPSTAKVVPWQFADLDQLGLTLEQVESAVQWVGPDGAVSSGPDAIAALLRDAGRLWTLPGRALQSSPVRFAAWPAYNWVADHRHLLPGGTAACSLPQAQREKLYGSRAATSPSSGTSSGAATEPAATEPAVAESAATEPAATERAATE